MYKDKPIYFAKPISKGEGGDCGGYVVADHSYVGIQDNVDGEKLFIYGFVHEDGHRYGFSEAMTCLYARQVTNIDFNVYNTFDYRYDFDEALMNTVGGEKYWKTICEQKNRDEAEKAYAEMWNDNFSWLFSYEDLMKVKTVQYILCDKSYPEYPEFKAMFKDEFIKAIKEHSTELLPLFATGNESLFYPFHGIRFNYIITNEKSLIKAAQNDNESDKLFFYMIETFNKAISERDPEIISKVQAQFKFMSELSCVYKYTDKDTGKEKSYHFKLLETFLSIDATGGKNIWSVLEAKKAVAQSKTAVTAGAPEYDTKTHDQTKPTRRIQYNYDSNEFTIREITDAERYLQRRQSRQSNASNETINGL